MIWVVTWWWGDKYQGHYVERLSQGVTRHLEQPHKFVVVSDKPEASWEIPNPELTKEKGCFARLRLFDLEWLTSKGVEPGDRIVCIDLDSVITGPLDPLFNRAEPFLILQGANAANPC